MGASQSAQVLEDEDEDEDEEEEEAEQEEDHTGRRNDPRRELGDTSLVKKVLEQEPEMLPCHASASPLSPQLSSFGTPRLGPSIKVWDPYNVLAPPPPPPPLPFSRSFSSDVLLNDARTITEVFLISHGDWHMNLRPDLIAGRCPDAALTPNGKRQARALAVFLKSQGVRFNAVYTSPLDRARATAVSVCLEMNLAEEQIQSSDALLEMSQGHWEGCHRSEIYTPEIVSLMDRFQPDFSAPSGESLRQVEFRMVQFLNGTVLGLPEKFISDFSPPSQHENQEFSHHNSHAHTNSIHDGDGPSLPPPNWDLLHRNRQGLSKKKSGKSRLQFVTTTGDHEADDEMSPRVPHSQIDLNEINFRLSVFSQASLGAAQAMSHRICIEDSSITCIKLMYSTMEYVRGL
ncbi:hypothetical protein HYC85_002711 [Camellia sinensis]|uniref:Uncharacterized protein n=1 Tax=Camellia sinensis TaxID=4442 RepID=A0A7J7I938_CAMSI|nr:hypothetical protein HYC85_002711 [Camellia sinensis]